MPDVTLAALKRVHPLWLARRERWLVIRDVMTGPLPLPKYVPRAKFEPDDYYTARLALTEFVSESAVARNRMVGALFGGKVDRKLDTQITAWATHVDLRKQSVDHWLETLCVPVAMDYGAAHVLVDRLDDAGPAPVSRLEQQARGTLEPFLCVYTPLEVRNWQMGRDGALEWAVIVEEGVESVSGEGGPAARVPVRHYRYFGRSDWTVITTRPRDLAAGFPAERWDPRTGEPLEDTEGAAKQRSEVVVSTAFGVLPDGLQRVPLVSLIFDPLEELIGRSLIEDAVKLDLKVLRLDSDLQWDLYQHAHPTLAVTTSDQMAELGVGANAFLKLKPGQGPDGQEDAKYLELPAESFAARERAIAQARADVHRVVGLDPTGVVSEAPSEASGVARAWSFNTTEARHLGRQADRVEDFEGQLYGVAAAFLGVPAPAAGSVRWPESFENTAPTQLLEDGVLVRQQVRSPTARKVYERRLVRALIGEVTPAEQAQIDHETETLPETTAAVASPLDIQASGE